MSDIEDGGLDLGAVFTEPPRPPTPEPTFATYARGEVHVRTGDDWEEIKIRLVGTHPLWAHHLWNAALALADFLDSNPELYRNLSVLELGAGGGLPSIVAGKNGAHKVVVTDYPDADLIDNIKHNVTKNVQAHESTNIEVQGYIWGKPVDSLLRALPSSAKFDLVILSDLIFNHSQHDALLKTCELVLSSSKSDVSSHEPCVLVFYTHHRPHLAHRDMIFFSKAKELGWHCEEIVTRKFPPMFPEDSGEEAIRATVHGWKLVKTSNKS
ncbi:nicotinamide N-methyltransferase [Crassisporium funariophilum]|nr:nicotinamide N-methyltransferase [Crassisporium funariophilum]